MQKVQRVKSSREVDMTNGKLLPKILKFALPLMFTGVLQLLFNAADMIVVGQFVGDIALAAVGATSNIVNLLVNLFMGLSIGAGVVMAKHYGAKNEDEAHDLVHTAMPLSLILGIAVLIIGLRLAKPMLVLLKTPDNCLPLSNQYLSIYFFGTPFLMIYNFGASILRAIGDTVRPLIYLTIAGVMNVIVNLITVICFNMGVAGVAYATITSQGVSAILVTISMLKEQGYARLSIKNLKIKKKPLLAILRFGVPSGIQSSLFSISNSLIQSTVNSFGDTVLAANTAAQGLEGFVFVIMNSVATTASTAVGQNYGAGDIKRIKASVVRCLACSAILSVSVSATMYLLRKPLLSLYTSNPEAIAHASKRMAIILGTYFFFGLMDVFTQSMRGMGYSIVPMIIVLFGTCVFRVAWIYTVFPLNPEYINVIWSYAVSWVLTFTIAFIVFLVLFKNRKKQFLSNGAVTKDG